MIQNTIFPDNLEQALDYAFKILQDRAKDPDRSNDSRCSYESAATILGYARRGDMEALTQFDY